MIVVLFIYLANIFDLSIAYMNMFQLNVLCHLNIRGEYLSNKQKKDFCYILFDTFVEWKMNYEMGFFPISI